jgi:thiamine transport system ATP-binding protein
MTALDVRDLRAGYGTGPDVLTDVRLDVAAGEVVALLGASGSGKSTLLRCIAGLHPIRSGAVTIGGQDMRDVRVERRGVGLVFQDHALFPHRDVAENVAFGPRMQGLDPEGTASRVAQSLADVGLTHLRERAIDELSGGEQQRVALARALAARPRLLLLDEPYGSLDRPLRERLASELPGLVRSQRIGAVLVTHDQQEALRAADRIAVMVDGAVRQLDTPERLWRDPVDADVATFLGVGPLLDADVRSGVAHGPSGSLPLSDQVDGPIRLLVPHRSLRIGDATTIGLAGIVVETRFSGDHHRIEIELADGQRATIRVEDGEGVTEPGRRVTLTVRPDALRVFPPRSDTPASQDERARPSPSGQ